jgi:hypothetical protein
MRKVICDYDVIAIQEIRDVTHTVVDRLLQAVNMECGYVYGARPSVRSGTTDLKEQIAFFYRIRTAIPIDSYTPEKATAAAFERPPFVGLFQSVNAPWFKFIYVAVHIKPTRAVEEMNALIAVYRNAVNKWRTEVSSAFIMGDFKCVRSPCLGAKM